MALQRRGATATGSPSALVALCAAAGLCLMFIALIYTAMILGRAADPVAEAAADMSPLMTRLRDAAAALEDTRKVKTYDQSLAEVQDPRPGLFTLDDLQFHGKDKVAQVLITRLPDLIAGERARGFCHLEIKASV